MLDAYVTKVLTEPYHLYGKWAIDVEYSCWGSESTTTLFFDWKEEALSYSVGTKFLC